MLHAAAASGGHRQHNYEIGRHTALQAIASPPPATDLSARSTCRPLPFRVRRINVQRARAEGADTRSAPHLPGGAGEQGRTMAIEVRGPTLDGKDGKDRAPLFPTVGSPLCAGTAT
jgi:hypothetical protein